MAKKDKLYTVNSWNRPLFMQKEKGNIFAGAGPISVGAYDQAMSSAAQLAKAPVNPVISNAPKINVGGGLANLAGGLGGDLLNGAASAVGQAGYSLISGGLNSGAGAGINKVGGAVGGLVGKANPVLGAAVTAASGIIGGGVNALVGTAVDEEKLNAAKEGTAELNNFTSTAGSIDEIEGPQAVAAVEDAHRGGLLKKGWAKKKNAAVRQARADAQSLAFRSVDNNVDNLMDDQLNDNLANYAAFGGPLDSVSDAGALEYSLMSDWLTYKKQQADNKNTMTNLFMSTPKDLFAFGGDMQTNGGDFSTNLRHINAGGRHEENPNGGVQQGVDPQGVPNLLEEGETVYNNYVYSDRILADETTKKVLHLPKKKDITYAEITKKLEKDVAERPNDPIAKATFKSQMLSLQEQQERQKKEMEAEKAQALFASLPPEEQAALMQQVTQQAADVPQEGEEQAVSPEEAAMMQQQEAQPSEEELLAMQQQQAMADGSQANVGTEPQVHACGGHLYKKGGALLKKLGITPTLSDLKKWLKDHKVEGLDYDKETELSDALVDALLANSSFKAALQKEAPSLYHAIENGKYDWGVYQRPKDKVTFGTLNKGNWKATDGAGWVGSDDAAFLKATEGMSEEDIKKLSTEDLAKLMKATDEYKQGTKWLQDSNNALSYLNAIINDPDTPQAAKDYALKFAKDGKWNDGFQYDYGTVFGKDGKGVRETYPGTFWHLPKEAYSTSVTKNFVLRPDGTVEAIIGDVPQDWKLSDTYSWVSQEDNNDNTYNYYSMPEKVAPVEKKKEEEEVEEPELVPIIPDDSSRKLGLLGPTTALMMQGFGVGKPNYSALDNAVAGAGNVALAGRKSIGNYLTYKPMDIWFEQNKMDANARALDRNLLNNAAPTGTKAASLLAANYNNQIADGELYRKALEYNDTKQQQVAAFNKDTDQFNANAYNQQSQFNASAKNEAISRAASAKLSAAQAKLEGDADWYGSIYNNINNFYKGMSDYGKENTAKGWRNVLATSGAYGVIDKDALVAAGMAKYKDEDKHAEGGKLRKKKRKGLTF